MDIFDLLTMIGGLSLFLFGMSIMGQALERRAGGQLRSLLGRLTTNKLTGLMTGLGVTAVIQSSSATTVMVVGFVNSGLMTLRQAINVIMGANVGTTVTAWVLSLAGIDSGNLIMQLLKPSSFTPVLALLGIVFYMFCREPGKKDTGTVLLGFATLMFGMETMSGAVSGLGEVPGFQELFVMFRSPLLGVLAGAVLTAVIQSSSASVGVLQALAVTGCVSYGAAIPIIMGQNIGTCVTAMLSSVGATKNAKRAAMVHLSFNVIGSVFWLTVFSLCNSIFHPAFFAEPASLAGIAVTHSVFNILCTVLMLPMAGILEKLVEKIVPDAKHPEVQEELDTRLLAAPPIALKRCREVAEDMARTAVSSLEEALGLLKAYSPQLASSVREKEEKTDHYEDVLGTYLVKLGTLQTSEQDSREVTKLLKIIGDFERISDHAVNIAESAEELRDKNIQFTDKAEGELAVLCSAVSEILELSLTAFAEDDLKTAAEVEPLEQVIDQIKEQMRTSHILRLQQGGCTIDAGFVWSDLLTDLERTADHCSNVAGCLMETARRNTRLQGSRSGSCSMNLHEVLREFRNDSEEFRQEYERFASKYRLG